LHTNGRRLCPADGEGSPEEREAQKGLALVVSMTDALTQRGVPDLTARVAAELA
jgi:hypothetical protein